MSVVNEVVVCLS